MRTSEKFENILYWVSIVLPLWDFGKALWSGAKAGRRQFHDEEKLRQIEMLEKLKKEIMKGGQ